MNNCTFIGNLTADVVTRTFENGTVYANFSIAVNRPYASKNGQKLVDYIKVSTSNKLAENCAKYLSKGSKVGVTGALETSSYEKNGTKIPDFKIVAANVDFLSSKSDGQSAASGKAAKEQPVAIDVDDSDMPF